MAKLPAHSKNKQSTADNAKWHLRVSADNAYGQLTLAALREWAEQDRVAAGNEVSRDGVDWVPVESIPDLKMDWLVTLKGGAAYGPVNLLAVPSLFARGVIDESAVLENRVTHRQLPAKGLIRRRKELANNKPSTGRASAATDDRPSPHADTSSAAAEPTTPPPVAIPHEEEAVTDTALPDGQLGPRYRWREDDPANELQAARSEIARLTEALAKASISRAGDDATTVPRASFKERVLRETHQALAALRVEHEALEKSSRGRELQLVKTINDLERRLNQASDGSTEEGGREKAAIKERDELAARLEAQHDQVAEARKEMQEEKRSRERLALELASQEIEQEHLHGALEAELEELRRGTVSVAQYEQQEKIVEALNAEISQQRERISATREKLEGNNKELQRRHQDDLNRMRSNHERYRRESEAKLAALEAALAEHQARQRNLKDSKLSGDKALDDTIKAHTKQLAQLQEARAQTEQQHLQELDAAKQSLIELFESKQAEQQKTITELETQLAEMKAKQRELLEERREWVRERESNQHEMARIQTMQKAVAGERDNLASQLAGLQQEMEASREREKQLADQKVAKLHAELSERIPKGDADAALAAKDELIKTLQDELRDAKAGQTHAQAAGAAQVKRQAEEIEKLTRALEDQAPAEKAVRAERDALQKDLADAQAKYTQTIAAERQQRLQTDQELAGLTNAILKPDHDAAIAEKEQVIASLKAELKLAQTRLAEEEGSAGRRSEEQGRTIVRLETELRDLNAAFAELSAAKAQLTAAMNDRVSKSESQKAILEKETQIDALTAELKAARSRVADHTSLVDALAESRTTVERLTSEQARLQQFKDDAEALASQCSEKDIQLAALRRELAQLQSHQATAGQRAAELSAKLNEAMVAQNASAERLRVDNTDAIKRLDALTIVRDRERLRADKAETDLQRLRETTVERRVLDQALAEKDAHIQTLTQKLDALQKKLTASAEAATERVEALKSDLDREREGRLTAETEVKNRVPREQLDTALQAKADTEASMRALRTELNERITRSDESIADLSAQAEVAAGTLAKERAESSAALQTLKSETAALRDERDRQKEALSQLEKQRIPKEMLKTVTDQHAATLGQLQAELDALKKDKSTLDAVLKQATTSAEQAAKERDAAVASRAALDEEARKKERERETAFQELQARQASTVEKLAEAESRAVDLQKLEASAKTWREERKAMEGTITKLEAELQGLTSKQLEWKAAASTSAASAKKVAEELAAVTRERARLEEQLSAAHGKHGAALETLEKEHAKALEQLRIDLKNVKAARAANRIQIDGLAAAIAGEKESAASREAALTRQLELAKSAVPEAVEQELTARRLEVQTLQEQLDRARRESELVRVAATKDLAGVQSAAEQFRAEKENLLTKMSELAREHERERVAHEDALARHAEEVAAKASLVESLEREREVLTKQLQSVEAKQASREKEQLESMNSLKAEQAASIEAVNRLQHELQALKLAQASADEKREQAAESLQAAMALELQAAREAFDTERRDLLAEKEGEVERLLGDVESMRQAEEAMEQAYAERMRLLDLERSAQLESMEFAHRQVLARLESDHEAALRQAGDTSGRAAETERIKRLEAELNKKDAALASLRDQFNELQSTKDSDGETLGAREVALKDRLASLDAALSELTQSRPSSWYLKQDDGSVYGPVSLDVLVEWAADCRIGPGHQASTNKVDWVTVTTLSELRMVWMVTLEDGSVYGPLNLFGALELREQGVLSPEGIVVNQAGAGEGSLDRMMVVESRALARLEKERRQRTETLAAAVASLRDQLAEEPTT